MGEAISAKDNIEYPLSAFTQLLSSSPSSYDYGWSIISEKGGWTQQWLDAQNTIEKGVEEDNLNV